MKFSRLMGVAIAGLLLVAGAAEAQKKSYRSRTVESSFLMKFQDNARLEYEGGTWIDIDDDYGWGFRFGFNYTENLSLGFQFDWLSSPYTAYLAPAEDTTEGRTIRHKLDMWSGTVKGVYHFFPSRFTPFIEGGLGWATIDSNVASSPPITGCYWHPWWGLICDRYQSSYTDTSFSYELGAGLRFEATNNSFVRASISRRWIDADFATNSPAFYTAQIEIGAMIWD
ncbi:opacity protein-like surface antigen [Alteromonadaceae bacterium 2753L.S.0a.02]|nr:opacity protein-like surface antigen [Alteromonadaceae bacterium 2753L.S.0a.02]